MANKRTYHLNLKTVACEYFTIHQELVNRDKGDGILKVLRYIIKIFRTVPKNAEDIRKRGGIVGNNFNNYGIIDTNHINLLSIGDNVTIASGAKLEFHDASTKNILGYSKIGRVSIGNNVFIGANSLILPNVAIGDNCIIGAGSVVVRDIPPGSVAVGNPCKVVGTYEDFVNKTKKLFESSKVYTKQYDKMSDEEKRTQSDELKEGGFAFGI